MNSNIPEIIVKIESKSSVLRTLILNSNEIGKSLKRDPAEIIKYFGDALKSSTKYNAEKNIAILNGPHRVNELTDLLKKYIETFVVCSNCKSCETNYYYHKRCFYLTCQNCNTKNELIYDKEYLEFLVNNSI